MYRKLGDRLAWGKKIGSRSFNRKACGTRRYRPVPRRGDRNSLSLLLSSDPPGRYECACYGRRYVTAAIMLPARAGLADGIRRVQRQR